MSSTPSRMCRTWRSPDVVPSGQVHLRDVAGDDHLRPEAESGEEHLHLLGRGVLRLVEDDERVVQRPAAHVRQRCDLDGPGGHQPRDRVRVDHVVKGVVERPQVGVDLVVEGAREEPEPLPRLDGRAGEDDPGDLLRLQGGHGLGHREVGLAGTRRPDPEDDGVLVDRVDVALLVQRLRPDRAAAVADDVHRQNVGRTLAGLAAEHRDRPLDGVAVERLAGVDDDEQLVDQPLDQRHLRAHAAQRDLVAADVHVEQRERPFDGPQQLVTRSEERDHRERGRDRDDVRRDGRARAGAVEVAAVARRGWMVGVCHLPASLRARGHPAELRLSPASRPQPGGQAIRRPPSTCR